MPTFENSRPNAFNREIARVGAAKWPAPLRRAGPKAAMGRRILDLDALADSGRLDAAAEVAETLAQGLLERGPLLLAPPVVIRRLRLC